MPDDANIPAANDDRERDPPTPPFERGGEGGSADAGDLPADWLSKLKINIPGYRLLSVLGRGGQAVVFKAIQESTGQLVAIKLLRGGPITSPSSRERFDREVRALATITHPNIVGIIDTGQTRHGHGFLVMRYIAGRSLQQVMDDQRFFQSRERGGTGGVGAEFPLPGGRGSENHADPAAMLTLFKKICEAVSAAHAKGIVHRDLSPSNVIVDERNEPHIVDFGLARTAFDRLMQADQRDITVTGQFLGKLAYASPEQAQARRDEIDARTDVYALGVILYQILTGGRFPYAVVGNIADVLNNIAHAKPTPPSKVNRSMLAPQPQPAAPPGGFVAPSPVSASRNRTPQPPEVNPVIEAIVLKALEKDPMNRYQTALEFARDIDNYLLGQSTLACAALPLGVPWRMRFPRLSVHRAAMLVVAISLSAVAYGVVRTSRFGERAILPVAGGEEWRGLAGAAPDSAQRPLATSSAPASPDPYGDRFRDLTTRLDGVEKSIKACTKELTKAGYREKVELRKGSEAAAGNANMDRQGGGPISLKEFYGKSPEKFFYHPVDRRTFYINPRPYSNRPSQFDYVYRANDQKLNEARQAAAALAGRKDALLLHRRELEDEQVALWARMAALAVAAREVQEADERPLYGFSLTANDSAAGLPGTAEQRATAMQAFAQFVRTSARAFEELDEAVQEDQGAAYQSLKQELGSAKSQLAKQLAAVAAPTVSREMKPLRDWTTSITDAADRIVKSRIAIGKADQTSDELARQNNRGILVFNLLSLKDGFLTLDDGVERLATQWKLEPLLDKPLPVAQSGETTTFEKQASGQRRPSEQRPTQNGSSETGAALPGSPIDLLSRVQLPKDALRGNWQQTKQGIQSDGTFRATLALGAPPNGDYEFRIEVTPLEGDGVIFQKACYKDHSFALSMPGRRHGKWFFVLMRRDPGDIVLEKQNSPITNQQRHVVIVRVRDGDVSATFDGELVARYRGNFSNLKPWGAGWARRGELGILTCRPTLVHSAKLTPISAQHSAESEPASPGNQKGQPGNQPPNGK